MISKERLWIIIHNNLILLDLIKKTGINSLGRVVNQLLRYISVLILVKYLGTTEYGYLTIGMTIMSIGIILSNAGLNYGTFRFVPFFIAKDQISKVKGVILFCMKRVTIYSIIVAISLNICAELIAINFFNKPSLVSYIQLFSLAIPLSVMSAIIFHSFKGFNYIKYKVLIEDVSILIIRILLYLSCLYLGLSTVGIIASYSISLLIGLIAAIFLLIKIFI